MITTKDVQPTVGTCAHATTHQTQTTGAVCRNPPSWSPKVPPYQQSYTRCTPQNKSAINIIKRNASRYLQSPSPNSRRIQSPQSNPASNSDHIHNTAPGVAILTIKLLWYPHRDSRTSLETPIVIFAKTCELISSSSRCDLATRASISDDHCTAP